MKSGTSLIFAAIKARRGTPITRENWSDLLDDLESMGRDDFLKLLDQKESKSPKRKTESEGEKPKDELADKMARYRKQSGLGTFEFNEAVREKVGALAGRAPSKAIVTSAAKFLTYLRKQLSDDVIEAHFAQVLREFA